MVVYHENLVSYRVGLQRTTVGSSVPISVVKGSFLMYDNAVVDERIHCAVVSVVTNFL